MDKVKLEFKTPKNKTIEYGNVEIEIKPFLAIGEQAFLINRYVEEYFQKLENGLVKLFEYNYLEAEYNLVNYVYQICTNINVDDSDFDVYSDFSLTEKILSEIVNYQDFRNKLDFVIKEKTALINSTGKVFSDLLGKAYSLLDGLSNISPDEIEKARTTGLELIKKLEESSVLGNKPLPVKKTRKKRVQ